MRHCIFQTPQLYIGMKSAKSATKDGWRRSDNASFMVMVKLLENLSSCSDHHNSWLLGNWTQCSQIKFKKFHLLSPVFLSAACPAKGLKNIP